MGMNSFQYKFIFFILLIFLVSTLFNGIYEYHEHQEMLVDSKVEEGMAIINGVNAGFTSVSDLENKESLLKVLNNVKWQNPEIKTFQIFLLTDGLISFYPKTDIFPDEKNLEVLRTKQSAFTYNNNILTVYSPIFISGVIVGTEMVEISMESYQAKLKKEILDLIILYGIFYFSITIIILFFIRLVILNPVNKIKLGIERFKEGNFDQHITLNSKDEFEEISNSFNEMSKEIVKLNSYHEHHAKELETEVNKRTKELESRFKELENTKLAVMNILEDTDETNKDLTITKEELNKKVAQLDEVNKKKDEFLSVTAHELKTPLTSIKGFTQLLKMDSVMKNKEMRDKYFDIIIQDTARLGNLITDILDLSRFDLGTLKFNLEDVSADDLVIDVQNLVGLQVKNKGLKFPISCEKNIMLNIDRSRIVQVISNFVNNSIKYTQKGEIRLEIFRKEKGIVHFRVTDTGVGIPKSAQPRIFERFYQADSSYTRKVGGSGLGLSICKAIVEAHDGKVWFESKPGRTMFEFTLNEKVK